MDTCCVCGAALEGAARAGVGACPVCGADLSVCAHEHRARTLEPEFMSTEPEIKHGDRAAGAVKSDIGVELLREEPRGPGLSERELGEAEQA